MKAEEPSRNISRPKWKRVLLFALLLIAFVAAFHSRLLGGVYAVMVENESTDACRVGMIMDPTAECFDFAAEQIHSGRMDRILLVSERPPRPARIGAIEPYAKYWVDDLFERGLESSQIQRVQTNAVTKHQLFRELTPELDSLNSKCAVIATSTMSRHTRIAIDQALEAGVANRYRVVGIDLPERNAQNWWRSRRGVAMVMNHGLRLAFVWIAGESEVDQTDPYQHLEAAVVSS